ncbi:MAG: UDP-N-acetylmuramate--L-alanine ligase [Betaproteobacteria bacterium]|nr:UDP-N-acetylmuramate--L-alanine ligase [Betaproteobacteria bacterium]MDE2131519.1 UDP-N-acetylmuramate--L-alanine ligase [Betaproteobacteria bacterium]MDE2211472.1 UDP-N-acetylmuramate--L-alanine ligase [Betaproteobacteria bacterium]
MKHKVQHVHFVGIGGSGMSGIAEVLLNLGYEVSGSDLGSNAATVRLAGLGAVIWKGHDAAHVEGADAVVVSTAVTGDNPEVVAARAARIPVVPRATMLAELMRLKKGIAVAGTHGKTTTTSLIASVLAEAGLDPTFVIGGRLNSAGSHAALGSGEFIVAEADESDASFLVLQPVMAVVTNIDADHMETYGHDFGRLKSAFVEFLEHLPFYGVAVLCTDDPVVREILPRVSKPVVTYGFSPEANVRAVDVVAESGRMRFGVELHADRAQPMARRLEVVLNLPGRHNVLNALAAISVAVELGAPYPAIIKALEKFNGVARRFQRYGDLPLPGGGHFTLVDDYGHHPVEMQATLSAARGAFPGRRLVLAFQPHRYTRTRDCFDGFIQVLSSVDRLVLAPVYAAGEPPVSGADSLALAAALRKAGVREPLYVENSADLAQRVLDVLAPQDVLITMGAGSIGQLPAQLVALAGGRT